MKEKKKMSLLLKLVIAIVLGIVVGFVTPGMGAFGEVIIRIGATYNSIFGNFLNFVIPLIIIGFVAPGIADLGAGAGKTLAATTGVAYGSTIISGTLAFVVASLLYPHMVHAGMFMENAANAEETVLSGYFTIEMPAIMGVMTALLMAFILGLGMAVIKGNTMKTVMNEFAEIIDKLVSNIVIPLLPFHVYGIFAKLAYAGTIVEIMGRHAGWLAGAAALATAYGAGPDLVYLPEVDFDMDQFLADVERIYKEKGNCMVAVSEGIHYADGSFVSEAKTSATDGFGHAQLGGLASLLAQVVKEKTGAKVRGIELSLLQRCGAHLASETDIEEAVMSGMAAVENAVNGITDKMVGFERSYEDGQYVCKTKLLPLTDVANTEKKVPIEWINAAHNGVEKPFIDYVLPLIQGEPKLPKEDSLPRFAKLKKVLVK